MATITDSPVEIVHNIFRQLYDVDSLLAASQTCRYLYACYKRDSSCAYIILQKQVTPRLLKYLITMVELERTMGTSTEGSADGRVERSEDQSAEERVEMRAAQWISKMLDSKDDEAEKFAVETTEGLSIEVLLKMSRFHELVQSAVELYANEAWAASGKQQPIELSDEEHFRIARSFYRLEIFNHPCHPEIEEVTRYGCGRRFFARFPPWEVEQQLTIIEFLMRQIDKETRDFIDHDIHCGARQVELIRPTHMSSSVKISWVCAGVELLGKLRQSETWDDKAKLLDLKNFNSGLHNSLWPALRNWSLRGVPFNLRFLPLNRYTEEQLDRLTPYPGVHQVDEDACKIWLDYYKSQGLKLNRGIITMDHYGRRMRGWVFWDRSRYDQFKGLKSQIIELTHQFPRPPNEQQIMSERKSWEERRKLWIEGAYGYWDPANPTTVRPRDPALNMDPLVHQAPMVTSNSTPEHTSSGED
ncbi:hypothetical protein HJFPF1_08351 [Paramyrothecium foliicola]|nr:hypothetical protein HJFPF1_08351 [Paramyrothecium foliicola]